ncbi:TPA: AAA family ATPase [Legionella pneumophila]
MIKPILKSNFFILTGGPGSGKTSVLNKLAQGQYKIIPEVARAIIKHQQAIEGNAIHTGDRDAFLDLMLKYSIEDFQKIFNEKRAVFFDRGIPDLYGYAKVFCRKESQVVNEAVSRFRYNKTVFIFPPWEEIYRNDNERQQDYAESLKTYQAIKEAYSHCSYDLVTVPKVSVENRVDFILKTLTKAVLTDLKNDINQLLGFHEGTPRINYGPCGVFAKLFFDAWNSRFKDKVHIVFVMMKSREECWHIAIRLPTGELYDGGVGIHSEESYGEEYLIEDMFVYDEARLEKWSYGLDRKYPRFCPDFDKEAVDVLIQRHLDCIAVKNKEKDLNVKNK